MLRISTISAFLFLMVCTVSAETKSIQFSLAPNVASLYDTNTIIEGPHFAIWGENEQHALALGLINGSKGNSSRLSLGLANYAYNYEGFQLGIYNTAKNYVGFSGAILNLHRENFSGWQFGLFNRVGEKMTGLQTAVFNVSKNMNGVQIGFLNYTEIMEEGLQIGAINIVRNTPEYFKNLPEEVAPVMLFLNWKF